MINRCIIFFCLVTFTTPPSAATAQPTPHLTGRLTVEEGLSSNTINDIVQDDNGFLWIATTDGLNRFDGTDIVQYYHRSGSNSLPHSYIYCLKKLPGNYLAIGTQSGLSFYDGNTGSFQNFYYRQNNGLDSYNNTITKLEIDASGNLWAASTGCLFIFDRQRKLKRMIASPFTEAAATRGRLNFVDKIWPLSNGNVLLYLHNGWHIGSAEKDTLTTFNDSPLRQQLPYLKNISYPLPFPTNGSEFPYARLFKVFDNFFLCIFPGKDSLVLLDEKGNRRSSCWFPYNKYPYISWSQQAVAIDSSGILLLLHNYGMLTIPIRWQQGTPALSSISPLLFSTDEYKTAIRDRQNNWWLATTREGLQRLSPSPPCFTAGTLIDRHSQKPARYETMACIRHGQKLWVSTYGNGFFETDLLSGRTIQHRLENTGNDTWANFIWNIRQINADTLWIGTQCGLFWYSLSSRRCGRLSGFAGKPAALDSVAITTQFTDHRGLTWIGMGKGKGLCCYDNTRRCFTWYPGNNAQAYPLRYPTNITEGEDGGLWFTSDASTLLVHWTPSTGRFRTISLPASTENPVGNLSSICSEGDSILWMGSITCGLLKYTPRTNSLVIYSHEKGLNNSHIWSIYEDRRKRLWLVTEGGLACFDQTTGSFINYTTRNGLPVSYPTGLFFYDSGDNRLYSGGHGKYFYFHPDEIIHGQSPERVMITSLQVNGKPWETQPDKTIRLHSQQNDITIQYAAIDMIGGPAILYAYRLTGVDTGWVMAGRQRQINFSHLAPGSYTFLVRAAGGNGIWSPQAASVSFHISPSFTATVWFYALLLLTAAAAALVLYRYRLRQLNRTRQVRSEISRNLHDEVGANLTNISLSSLLARRQLHDEGLVNQLLERIYQDSQLVSESMREIVWSINPDIDTLGDALPRMLQYAAQLLEARGIELHAEISPEVEQLKLSMKQRRDVYLIFKEAVNNMARHSKATRAFIHFHLSGNMLIMRIADNGSGFDTALSAGQNGLKNMQERAREHRWNLEILSGPQKGATITLNARIA